MGIVNVKVLPLVHLLACHPENHFICLRLKVLLSFRFELHYVFPFLSDLLVLILYIMQHMPIIKHGNLSVAALNHSVRDLLKAQN